MSEAENMLRVADAGWYALHLFYRIEHGQWALLTSDEQRAAKTAFTELVAEVRKTPGVQLLIFSMVTPKADMGFLLLAEDLHTGHAVEKKLSLSMGTDILSPVYSCLSVLERGGGVEGGMEWELPGWEVFCFHPLATRRVPGQNWYGLASEERLRLMQGCWEVAGRYEGRVFPLVTVAVGLDDAEGVLSLFAHELADVQAMVGELRAHPAACYVEDGEFYIGLRLTLDEAFRRLQL